MLKGTIGGATLTVAFVVFPLGLASPAARAATVYNNISPLTNGSQPLLKTQQVADDVTLAAGGRQVTVFNVVVVDNDHVPLTGDFTATFYLPDDKGLPGATIWQGTTHFTNMAEHTIWQLAWNVPNVTVPDSFIWGLSIDTTSSDIGPYLHDTPSVGSSQDVAYFNNGTGWSAYDYHSDGSPKLANFEAAVTTVVPEPIAAGLIGLAAAGTLATRRPRRRASASLA